MNKAHMWGDGTLRLFEAPERRIRVTLEGFNPLACAVFAFCGFVLGFVLGGVAL